MTTDPLNYARHLAAARAAVDGALAERLGEDPDESAEWHRLADDLEGWRVARAHLDLVLLRPDETYDDDDRASARELHVVSVTAVRERLAALRLPRNTTGD